MNDNDRLDELHRINEHIAFGRDTLKAAEAAVMRVDLGVTWRHGVTRDELVANVSVLCENLIADLAGAPDEAFTTTEQDNDE